jgi:hypothetical protein
VRYGDRIGTPVPSEVIVQEIMRLAGVERVPAQRHWKHLKATHPDTLKTYEVQASTKDRAGAITVEGQTRWFQVLDKARRWVAEQNTSPADAKYSFPDVEEHFTYNLDEENQLGSLFEKKKTGDGSGFAKKHHDNDASNCRESITALRAGSAAGYKTASFYLLKGKNNKKEYSSSSLQAKGAPPGSKVCVRRQCWSRL